MKQVLVIDKEDHFRCAVDALTKLGVGFETPGNLLAEFKGWAYKSDLKRCQDGGKGDLILFHTPPITDPPNRQSVTVLILACADEGSASDEESEGK